MIVRCHHGFGAEGPDDTPIPADRSFASLVLARGRTGYIEDISARPDLRIPQPKIGDPMVAILATPLPWRGNPLGAWKFTAGKRRRWNSEQVALIESLAAQTSVSLEAAQLFDIITSERNRFRGGAADGARRDRDVRRTVHPDPNEFCRRRLDESAGRPGNRAESDAPQLAGFPRRQADGPRAVSHRSCARRGEEIQAEEVEAVMAGGRRVFCLTYAKPIRDAEGVIQGAVSIFVDISAQKELQRELDTRRRERRRPRSARPVSWPR